MAKKRHSMSAGHLTIMALGSVVGGSFFLGSSVAIHAAGLSILLSRILSGVLVSGIVMVIIFSMIYFVKFRTVNLMKVTPQRGLPVKNSQPGYRMEFSNELDEQIKNKKNK